MEVMHFKANEEGIDSAYGYTWSEVVNEYLKKCYNQELENNEVVVMGVTYKFLKRDLVTAFYDADGNTIFDVENARLAEEYDWMMNAPKEPEEESECQIAKQIDETGDEDLKCSGGVDEKCEDCEKSAEEEVIDEAAVVPMGTASLADIVTGNIPDPTPEEVRAAEEQNSKSAKERAKEKLEAELKLAKDKSFAEPIIGYLLKRCDEDEGLSSDVAQGHKTWDKCFSYIYAKAKKQAKENCAAVRDDVVYEWAEDYYHMDDKAEAEKKAKEASERAKQHKSNEKKQKEDQKKRIESMEKRHEKNGPSKQEKAAELKKPEDEKPKKNSKDMDGQLDLFSMMGM
ncbi:MAG: Cas9 inhibitor AcrIIA9 family protein [Hespellia sp.]|nr:Cas9 inhibitor AcrIIA9 family protein [Hespellia sp.]